MSLRDALAGVKQNQMDQDDVKTDNITGANVQTFLPKTPRTKKPSMGSRVSGKSSNPDFEKIGVYVRTKTRRNAERKWEDQAGGDLSDLIETLLNKYIVD